MKKTKRADAYDWGDTLGEGAFGAVVLATEKESGRKVAIKILNKQHITKEKKQKYVTTERDILAKCKHPNIIRLFNTFQDNENLYYILELAAEGELLTHLQKHKSFDVPVAAFYIAEIINALEHLHSKGIIHRDLKPENILLNDKFHVKVTDFGTAKDIEKLGRDRANSFGGTPEYISPELLEEQVAYKASDLWALGCILYQLIAGRPPFKGATAYLTIEKVKSGKVEYPEGFPEIVKDLCSKLLVKNPNERLGANSWDDLRQHSFFNGIEWENLHEETPPTIRPYPNKIIFPEDIQREEEERKRSEREELRERWGMFLHDDEDIVEAGFVYKRRKMSRHKRFFILSDLPRIVYVDTKKMEKKGDIIITPETRIDVKNTSTFNIVLPKRTYVLEDVNNNASKWKEAVESLRDKAR